MNDSTFENLRATLTRLDRQDTKINLIGNTNCDPVDNKNANTKRLKQVYSEFRLEQLIKTYKRVTIYY